MTDSDYLVIVTDNNGCQKALDTTIVAPGIGIIATKLICLVFDVQLLASPCSFFQTESDKQLGHTPWIVSYNSSCAMEFFDAFDVVPKSNLSKKELRRNTIEGP